MIALMSVLSVFANICLLFKTGHTRSYTEVYSWRDYYGEVPHDAIFAGFDKSHKPLYLGQVLYKDNIIAGKIIEGDENIHVEYFDVEYTLNKNVKVLCSHQPEKLGWIPSNKTEVPHLSQNRILIRGGFEPSCVTYLGRLSPVNNVTNVGKVMCCKGNDSCYGLYTTSHGTGQLHEVFEILAYVEDKPNTIIRVGTSAKGEDQRKLFLDVILDY
ncbi:hypothetical protein ILUMI_26581 [Ignelater luminosus]|uniref:Uncharacterized protein n=1 Tax=Ignelater luminosus TaxID=2038154 RepID=A0A8K0FXB8_IGNLU|nr:hypothetical protein ILUMI_26581 [Ignelater luminosus]